LLQGRKSANIHASSGVIRGIPAKVPAEQATTATKAYLAEFILKSAAGGLTNYEGLISAAVSQLPTILSMFT
jgi:hypothetical protein